MFEDTPKVFFLYCFQTLKPENGLPRGRGIAKTGDRGLTPGGRGRGDPNQTLKFDTCKITGPLRDFPEPNRHAAERRFPLVCILRFLWRITSRSTTVLGP